MSDTGVTRTCWPRRPVRGYRSDAVGATRTDIGQGDVDWVVITDPDGKELCVLMPR